MPSAIAPSVPDPLAFALTKIQPPRARAGLIERDALVAHLQRALASRLVLVSAPAGYGKTSALTQLIGALPPRSALAWIALDEDDDLGRVAGCVVAALEPWDLPWRHAPQALIVAAQDRARASRQALSAALLNALAGVEVARGVIVFDDAHRVTDPVVFEWIDALIERLPPHWSVVVASRLDPPLALARLRAAGELTEIRQDALGFTPDEVRRLVALRRPGYDEAELQALQERTQGWAAGLGLALSDTGGPGLARAGALRDRHLFDYLASEVLDHMPAALRGFLLRCSVLPELSAERCAAVSGDAQAAQWLDEIERRGLFASVLDGASYTLRLHDLFRDCLDDRLRRTLPEELPQLLQRAAAGEPDPIRRIGFLVRAGDWPAAEQVLSGAVSELLLQGAAGEVQRLIQQFPAAWRDASAFLQRQQGLMLAQQWQWQQAEQCFRSAAALSRAAGHDTQLQVALALRAAACHSLGQPDEVQRLLDELRTRPLSPEAELITLLTECGQHFDLGRHDRVAPIYLELLERLEQTDDLLTWWLCSPASAWGTMRGMRRAMERYNLGALGRCGARELPLRAVIHIRQANCHLWAGEVDRALDEAAIAEADARWLACSADTEATVTVFRLLTDALRGRADAVAEGLEALYRREDGSGNADRLRLWRLQVAVFGVRLTEVLGADPARLRHWAALNPDRPLEPRSDTSGSGRISALPARLAAAEGRWADASELFLGLLPHAPGLDLMGQTVELQLRAGHALARAGRIDEAAAALRPALERMRVEGEHGHALMAGPAVLAALADQRWGTRLDAEAGQQLRRLAAQSAHLRDDAREPAPAGDDRDGRDADTGPLSAREAEVLERIAAGDSNKLIARALDLSPHTVKRHVANILDKLALASRGQAAAWYREQR